jgi:hypothetical protein
MSDNMSYTLHFGADSQAAITLDDDATITMDLKEAASAASSRYLRVSPRRMRSTSRTDRINPLCSCQAVPATARAVAPA